MRVIPIAGTIGSAFHHYFEYAHHGYHGIHEWMGIIHCQHFPRYRILFKPTGFQCAFGRPYAKFPSGIGIRHQFFLKLWYWRDCTGYWRMDRRPLFCGNGFPGDGYQFDSRRYCRMVINSTQESNCLNWY